MIKSKLSPQKIRMLEALLIKPHTSRELMFEIGCQNPPDIVQLLRKKHGVFILCDLIPSVNRDGKKIKIGLYSIPDCERETAEELLKVGATAQSNENSYLSKRAINKEKYNMITA